eukprot:7736596-Alexandrium_andersonii.AAC.1
MLSHEARRTALRKLAALAQPATIEVWTSTTLEQTPSMARNRGPPYRDKATFAMANGNPACLAFQANKLCLTNS